MQESQKGRDSRQESRLAREAQGFTFYTERRLVEITGRKASDLKELLQGLYEVSGSSIFYHTHQSFLQRHFTVPFYRNDFATWVAEALGEEGLGERLASINIIDCSSIRELRELLIWTIEDHLRHHETLEPRRAHPDEVFYFSKSKSFVFPTNRIAHTLEEFAWHLTQISHHSLFYHVFVTRLLPYNRDRDFSVWVSEELGKKDLAIRMRQLDPYVRTLEDLKNDLVSLVAEVIGREETDA